MRTGGDVARERRHEAGAVAREREREAGDDLDGGLVIERASGTELVLEQVTSRAAADLWHQIAHECFEADYYEMPADPVQEVYERIESTRTDERYELWLGWLAAEVGDDAGTPVVLGELGLPMLDNVDNALVKVSTRPVFRERGYGTAMLHHLTTRARVHDRTRLIGEIGEPMPLGEAGYASPTPPGVLFATNVGARPVTSEVRRLLRIGELDDAELSRLKDDAIARSTDYSLIQWEGSATTEQLDDLVVLLSRLSIDAPLEELDWEPEQWSPERYRERERRVVASGQVCLSTAARHDPSGQLVALTEIGVASAQPDIAYQWVTVVLPCHRGHRLGMRAKLANLEFLRTKQPHVQMVNTWNAAINDHMVGINEAIGFRAVERWREWQLELSSPTSQPT
jgi:GNAT superfamily N-acetyltransferase